MSFQADENRPLLANPDEEGQQPYYNAGKETDVDFDREGDDENPLERSDVYKWGVVTLLALSAFMVTFTCIGVTPVANRIVRELNGGQRDKATSVLLVTIWELGEAAGPLIIAPFSELFGRRPAINIANTCFAAFTLMTSLAPNPSTIIAGRFLTGLSVASNVLNPSIVGDMFISEQRGAAMSIVMLAPLVGGAIGPALSGYIAETLGWRALLWLCAAIAAVCELAVFICFRETYKVTILNRRAKRLRKETGNENYRSVFEAADKSPGAAFFEAIMRPIIVLSGSAVLQILSLMGGVVFAYFYIMATTLPDILEDVYHLSPTISGICFMAFSAGSILSVIIGNRFLDRVYIALRDKHSGTNKPEYRLPFVIVGGFMLPVVSLLYGWFPQAKVHLSLMLIAVALMGAAVMLAILPLMTYVVDAFGLYSASATTAVIVTRCLMGTFLPLGTEPLVARLGYGWAFTVLAAFSLILAPIPVLVYRYGGKWRERSKYTRDE